VTSLARPTAGRLTRPGEVAVEVLRAYQLGQSTRQLLALRLTLSVATGTPGEVYRLASGVVDDADVGALASAVREISQTAASSTAPAPGVDTVEIDIHSGQHRPYKGPVDGTSVLSTAALPSLVAVLPPGTARITGVSQDFLRERSAGPE